MIWGHPYLRKPPYVPSEVPDLKENTAITSFIVSNREQDPKKYGPWALKSE